eukprot:TRINITY_DN5073_c0_g1_i9.p6 TRINITY_DN5073_c0_g1~~TRINITY_DN5073_c0_g1_i9.p6  ORF type:complete len:128 (-),score=25.49 TRINITY_DN5073_c0_g1_i9:491-874(-)
MNAPQVLSPETLAWFRVQMTIATARAVEVVRAELRAQDDFANGLLVVLAQVLPHLLKQHPELAETIAPKWRTVHRRYEEIEDGTVPAGMESLDFLEAQKLLFATCARVGVWAPNQGKKDTTRRPPRA